MLRTFLFLLALSFSPIAFACDCRTGDSCQCGETCSCSTPDSSAMSSPLNNLLADDSAGPSTVHVGVSNFTFSTNLTIFVGDTVQWDWLGGLHSVTSVAGSADPFSSPTQSSGSFSHLFTIPGTYNYYCVIHGFDNGDGTAGGMSASVTVLPLPEPASLLSLTAFSLLALRRRRT